MSLEESKKRTVAIESDVVSINKHQEFESKIQDLNDQNTLLKEEIVEL